MITEHTEHWTWETGESVRLPFTSVMEVRDGKVDRWWDYFDLSTLMNAATSPNRLIYQTDSLKNAIRISGSPKVSLNAAFSKRANFSAALVSFPEGSGNGTIVTRGLKF